MSKEKLVYDKEDEDRLVENKTEFTELLNRIVDKPTMNRIIKSIENEEE